MSDKNLDKLNKEMETILHEEIFYLGMNKIKIVCKFNLVGISIKIYKMLKIDKLIYSNVIHHEKFKAFDIWQENYMLRAIELGIAKTETVE